MRIRWISLVFLISLVLGSCAPSQPSEQNPAPHDPQVPPTEESLANTPEISNMPANSPLVEKFVALTKRDLADRLKVEAEKIALLQTAEMLWPNSALGCPSPGKIYPQGRVPGFKIWLGNGGMQYIYHTDTIGQLVLCPNQNEDVVDPPNSVSGSTQDPNIGVPIQ